MTVTALTFVLLAAAVLFLLKCLQAFSEGTKPRYRGRLVKAFRNAQMRSTGSTPASSSPMAD
ncbi:MAG TPA: hypothetical protein VFA89_05290 [Terriglobales bacterium]|nr:hypothetical protein [Terriglobales bacterium]